MTQAAIAGDCPELPPELTLRPGQEARLGALAVDVVPEVVQIDATTFELAIDALIRVVDPNSRLTTNGSYVPHLDVDYALSGGLEDAGRLGFRMSARGPSYGTTLRREQIPTRPVTLNLVIRKRPDAVPVVLLDGVCPELPLELRYTIDADSLTTPVAPATTAPSGNHHATLIGADDPLPQISSPYNDVWGYDDGTTFVAMLGSKDETFFFNVTDPGNPVLITSIPGPNSGWRDIKTFGQFVLIGTEGGGAGKGLQIVSMVDPLDPLLLATWDDTFDTIHNIWVDDAAAEAWIVGANSGTRILDISNVVAPVEIGARPSPYVHDAFVKNDVAYLSLIFDGKHEIADSSDPTNLQTLSLFTTPSAKTHNSWTTEDATILCTSDEADPGGHVGIYDITDPSNPIPLGEYQASTTTLVHNVMNDDDDDQRVAMSHYAMGFKYIDIHVPSIPIEIASYDTYPNHDIGFSGAWGVYAFDPRGYFYVSDRQTGLYILEFTPTGGILSGRVTDASTDQPITDIDVLILPENVVRATDSTGLYALHVEAGSVVVQVKAVGYRTALIDAGEMPVGGRLDVNVALEPLPRAVLAGTVRSTLDASGVEGVRISIAGTSLTTTTAAGGTYAFPEVAIGQQIVEAELFGFSSAEARIIVGEDPNTLDIDLEPAAYLEDAESDQGWTAAPLLNAGAWVRVDPNGTAQGQVQPDNDHTPSPGVTAFITGQSPVGAGVNDNDVEGGPVSLTSAAIDLSGVGAARIRYHRWFSNAWGIFQAGTMRAQVAPDSSSFATLETLTQNANNWNVREFDLGTFAALTNDFHVRFSCEAGPFDPDLQVLECGVDDIDIVRACAARFNPDQTDSDLDGIVNACDACPLDSANDGDGDGFCGDVDNTPFTNSPNQDDADGDGVGDAADNCLNDINTDQRDLDEDGLGDVCDLDLDGDGLLNESDPDQDDDGIVDVVDLCPRVPDSHQSDQDDDGQGDACDPDDGIVRGVRLHAGGLITWESETGADGYHLYRGDVGSEFLLPYATCRAAMIATSYFVDIDRPNLGDGFFFLVTRIAGGAEGTAGHKSTGVERTLDVPCP